MAPLEHVCYTCLLADKALDLSDMSYRATIRRILYHLRKQEHTTETQLVSALGELGVGKLLIVCN
jgi:hypothetical protein